MGNGRSQVLIRVRDEKLRKRYAYYTEYKHLSKEQALKILADQEFFISQGQIIEILNKQCLYHQKEKHGKKSALERKSY